MSGGGGRSVISVYEDGTRRTSTYFINEKLNGLLDRFLAGTSEFD